MNDQKLFYFAFIVSSHFTLSATISAHSLEGCFLLIKRSQMQFKCFISHKLLRTSRLNRLLLELLHLGNQTL